ncbi:MAG: hypothetical protein ACI8UO_006305 [Verrucomicrobiales bacterium]|jgi:hypothetical protein
MKRAQAIDLFIHKDKVALFWFAIAVVVSVGFWWERQRLVKQLTTKPQFFVMDANHTYYLPSAMDFGSAKQVHAAQTRLAMEAIFNRAPKGPDSPERLKRILGKDAFKKAQGAIAHEEDEFMDKQIHQKIELGAIQVLQVRDDSVLTGVEGQLIRSGVFRGKAFTEALSIKAQFKFILNTDMTANGRFPTVAIAFDFTIEPTP